MSNSRLRRRPTSPTLKGARSDAYEHTPRVELKQLRYFLAVAEHLNFTRAAEQMGIAQPPLSQQILALERLLNVKLFVRTRRAVSLTREGEALLEFARRLNNTTHMAAEVVRAISRGEDGPLAIGSIFSSIYAIIPHVLRPFVQTYPKVKVDLREMTVFEQISALKDYRIDAGICRGPIENDQGLESITLLQEDFVAIVPADHKFSSEDTLSMAQIAEQPVIRIMPAANRTFSRSMFGALLEKGYKLNISQEVSDMHTVIGLVAAGFGISLVPSSLQTIHIPQVRYIPLRERTATTQLQLVYNKDNPSPILPRFIQIASDIVPELRTALACSSVIRTRAPRHK